MREIRFRAYCKQDKVMYMDVQEGIDFGVGQGVFAFADFLNNSAWHEFEIMQYTMLKDKHGKEIYEGDILKLYWRQWLDETANVIFKRGSFGYGSEILFTSFCDLSKDVDYLPDAISVIGNIYENPELSAGKVN